MYIQVMEFSVGTTVLVILGSAFGVMFTTLTTLMVGAMRVQHRDSIETHRRITQASKDNRDLIEQASKDNRDLIEQASKDNRDLIEQASKDNRKLIERAADRLSAEFEEHKRVTERNHEKVAESLGDARERLARIEGHLRIHEPPAENTEPDDDASRQ